jgi:hypothetical protein
MVNHEATDTPTEISHYEEVTRLFADVSVIYPAILEQSPPSDGYRAEIASTDDDIIAKLVRKGIEYRERFATGHYDHLFDVHISPHLPVQVANKFLEPAKTQQYKLIALSVLLNNGVLDEVALGQALAQVQGNEFLESALHGAVGIITDYAHVGELDPRAGGTGLR